MLTVRSKQADRMRNSSLQVRWHLERHSLHISCCLLCFTPHCQALPLMARKQMEKRRLFPTCSHPGSHQQLPVTTEVHRLTARAIKDLSARAQKALSSPRAVSHALTERPPYLLDAGASKAGLEKQKQVLRGTEQRLLRTNLSGCLCLQHVTTSLAQLLNLCTTFLS